MKGKKDSYLNIEQTTGLKGVLALGVLLCHLVPASGILRDSAFNALFAALGYCVAVFFFLSGYGISAQYQAKQEQYLRCFLKNRVLSIYFLTLFLTVLYTICRLLTAVPISLTEILQTLLIGNTIIDNGWYLQIVMLFYVFWFISVKFIQNEKMQLAALLALILAYMLIAALYMDYFWFQSSLGFPLGVFWQRNKQKLDAWLFAEKKRVPAVAVGSFVAFAAAFLSTKTRPFSQPLPAHIFLCISLSLTTFLFAVSVLMLIIILRKPLRWSVLQVLGKHSLEIYVLQGIPLHVFKSTGLAIENGWLYSLCVLAATTVLAILMHPVMGFVTGIPKKFLQKGKSSWINARA